MNTLLSKKLDEILKNCEVSPELSDKIVQLFYDGKREAYAAAREELKSEIQLNLDIKDLKIELKDEIHCLDKNTVLANSKLLERIINAEKAIAIARGELEVKISGIRTEVTNRFAGMKKKVPTPFAPPVAPPVAPMEPVKPVALMESVAPIEPADNLDKSAS
jgi:hypothetical protein